jgi:beta-glucosidase
MKRELKFPQNFWWGASTSSHQIEGGNRNDWTAWEKANARELAKKAEKRFGKLDIWPEIKEAATNPANYISGDASDHWNRYPEDFNLAQEIGLNSYRLSIEWSRIEPKPGEYDQEAIKHYQKMLRALKTRGIEPFVTLWHWPLPQWLAHRGGWIYPEVSHYFISYAATMVRALPEVKYWITLNEPNVYTENSYFTGIWPPNQRSLRQFYLAVSNLIKAHREAYHLIKSINEGAQVGLVNNFIPYVAYRNKALGLNKLLQRYADLRWNFTVLQQTGGHLDFIGVNHYFGYRINLGFNKRVVQRKSDMGWELRPASMYSALRDLKKYKLPLIITESGLADRNDRYRGWYIKEVLKNVHRAIESGVDVRGYFHWSLMDNFEWDKGFWPRFGLIAIDYETQRRTLRPSALEYSKVVKSNSLIID